MALALLLLAAVGQSAPSETYRNRVSGRTVINVRQPAIGARGDGRSDDTQALQQALDLSASSRAEVLIPSGTYLVDCSRQGCGLLVRSGVRLRMEQGAVLRAKPNALPKYAILMVKDARDVEVLGGVIEGERDMHRGHGGEWGMGIHLHRSERIRLKGVTVRKCWGDGFYLSGGCRDVLIENVTADQNRRQGLSMVGAEGVVIRDSVFRNTHGVLPEAGLDIEPNAGEHVKNVTITGCSFLWNAGDGLATGTPEKCQHSAYVEGIVIDGNVFQGNGRNPLDGGVRNAIEVSNSRGTRVLNNRILDNRGRGIYFRHGADDSVCSGNQVRGTLGPPGEGISEYKCSGNRIEGNQITGSSGRALVSRASSPRR